MNIKIRDINGIEAVPFAKVANIEEFFAIYKEMDDKGIYMLHSGLTAEIYSYQFVFDGYEAYVEIIFELEKLEE